MITYTIQSIIAVLKAKGYALFEDDSKNYNLNLIGVRSNGATPNSFDDLMIVIWKHQGEWNMRAFPITTDPGTYWLEHPIQELGAAIVKEGQYRGLWQKALHQGKYAALCQRKPITVIRDFNKDNRLDFETPDLTGLRVATTEAGGETLREYFEEDHLVWRESSGLYGINCHRASENGHSINVDKWSAGCQVLQNREIINPDNQAVKVFEFDYFMHLVDQAIANWGNSFTYTLINENDF